MDNVIEMIDKRILELITYNVEDSIPRMEELILLKEKIVNGKNK